MKDIFDRIIKGRKKVAIFAVAVLLFAVFFIVFGRNEIDNEGSSLVDNCPVTEEEKVVRGNSLTGILEDGETVKVLIGHYDCNEIEREDLILYSYAGSEDPLIKIIKGVPGDRFELGELNGDSDENEKVRHIMIGGEIITNSDGESYVLNERGYGILSLYEESYGGVIPEDSYLILGNLIGGSTDSTRFGLVHRDDILGKVLMER